MTRLPTGPSPHPAGFSARGVAPRDIRRQVLLERAREVIRGPKAPVTPSPRIVDVLGPGVDDGLPAPVRRERDALVREGEPDELGQLEGAGAEGRDVVHGAREEVGGGAPRG